MALATHEIKVSTNGAEPLDKIHPRRLFLVATAGTVPTEYVDPTKLFLEIGAGGTGKLAVILHLRDPGISESTTIKSLVFDTDSSYLENIRSEDKFLMTNYPAARHFQELADYPERFPHSELVPHVQDYQKALGRAQNITVGLMTHRVLGRPLLDYYATSHYEDLADFFLTPVRQLHAYAVDACVRDWGNIQEELWLTVCFVASLCGGTGSGAGIDIMPNFVNYILQHQGGFTRFSLVADLFLPGVLESGSQDTDLLRANTQAALKKNLAALTEKLPSYRMGTLTLPNELPLMQLYLFDNINLQGHILEGREQVVQMRNLSWDLRHIGVSGKEHEARAADIHPQAPAIYSAAGAAKMIYDVEHVLKFMGYRTGRAVAQTLIQPLSAEDTAAAVDSCWSRLEHSVPDLMGLPLYQTTVAGAPIKLEVQPVVASQSRSRVGMAVNQAIRRARDEWEEEFAELQSQVVATKEQLLIDQVTEILNSPGGFEVAQGLLAKLRATYELQYAELREQFDLRRPQHDRLRERLPEVATRWRRWTWHPRREYVKAYQRYVDSLLALGRLQAQIMTLEQMIQMVVNLEVQRQHLQGGLSKLVKRLERDFEKYVRLYHQHQSVAVHSVVCDDELDGWYEAGADQAREQVLTELKIAWCEEDGKLGLLRSAKGVVEGRLDTLSKAGIANHLEHAQQPWQHLRGLSVEELFRRKELSPLKVYAQLKLLSAPWVSLNDVKVVPANHRLMILVSETDDFFHELPSKPGLHKVASFNPYEMTMLTTWHGIDPLDHLIKSEDNERAYQQKLSEGHALHLFPELFENSAEGAETPGEEGG